MGVNGPILDTRLDRSLLSRVEGGERWRTPIKGLRLTSGIDHWPQSQGLVQTASTDRGCRQGRLPVI